MVGSYPLMKRVTNWPQAFLGLTINWGALVGWAAAKGSLEPTVVLPLYLSGAAWTVVYDTVYAHQDKKDDVAAGVRSTALHFGEDTKEYLGAFGGLAVAGLVGAGVGAGVAWPFYAGVAGAASHLFWQIKTVDLDDPEDCAAKFRSNATYGALVFLSAVAGKTFAVA
jgi:4-hydroxybenzoate polyprenyltransferase